MPRANKLAKLPEELREQINIRLREGLSYPQIIKWLAEQGYPEHSKAQLSRWYRNQYQKWLRLQMWEQAGVNQPSERRG